MKMKNPCNELKMAKKYWNAMVLLSSAKIPNNHVIPSNGKRTTADLTPDLNTKLEVISFIRQNMALAFQGAYTSFL